MASFAGYLPPAGWSYAAGKAWVLSFTDSIAASLDRHRGAGHRRRARLGEDRLPRAQRPARPAGSAMWLEPEAVVDRCLADLARGRALCVPGSAYRVVVSALELPRTALRGLARLARRNRERGVSRGGRRRRSRRADAARAPLPAGVRTWRRTPSPRRSQSLALRRAAVHVAGPVAAARRRHGSARSWWRFARSTHARGSVGRACLLAVDPFRAGVNRRAVLLAAGVSDRELRRLRRGGEIMAVRPGAYVVEDLAQDAVLRHRFAVHAAHACLGAGAVISHVSAAVLHGLPLWAAPPARVHATRDRRSGARTSRVLHLHAAALEPDEVVAVDGRAGHVTPAHAGRPRRGPCRSNRRSCRRRRAPHPPGHARRTRRGARRARPDGRATPWPGRCWRSPARAR